jgi:hypothetical protein
MNMVLVVLFARLLQEPNPGFALIGGLAACFAGVIGLMVIAYLLYLMLHNIN